MAGAQSLRLGTRGAGGEPCCRAPPGVIGPLIALALASILAVLGERNRALEEKNSGLMRRFTEAHPGMLVPVYRQVFVRDRP